VELSFNHGSRKDFYINNTLHNFEIGDMATVEAVNGFDVGEISLSGELVRVQLKKKGIKEDSPELKKVIRKSSERDLDLLQTNKKRERAILMHSREIARDLKLKMKLSEVELQADGKKATFFYSADDRIDFREMIKVFASEFKVKVEMRQIGIRQEASKIGGIGSCGRELCCSTWLVDFKSVNTTAARYQNLSINQTKLSGQCGRLKCCLNFELDIYLDALQYFPDNADKLEVRRGKEKKKKKDIFKDLMWYTLPDSSKQYPLTLARVKEIQLLNNQGEKPDTLEAIELKNKEKVDEEAGYVDVVGQLTFNDLERSDKKRKQKEQARQKNTEKNNQPQAQKAQRQNKDKKKNNVPVKNGGNQDKAVFKEKK
jgi:cell fate regulator YaaT (PSP1 superfamily)